MSLKSTLKSLKLHESTISMVLGALVIVVSGVILINYFSNRQGQTVPPVEIEEVATEATTHTVQEGEDLWKISEQYYGTGFEWSKIAEANNISDPNQLEVGQTLTIPGTASAEIAQAEPTEEPAEQQLTPTEARQEDATASPEPTPIPTEAIEMEEATEEEPQEAVPGGEHTVASGENLWTIAERYYNSGYNWVDIASDNNLENPGLIEEGQKLNIPPVEPKLATVNSEEEPVLSLEAITGDNYSVVEGDSLWTIAVRAYGDGYRWPDIANENNLENPGLIHPGNELKLPR